MVRTSFIPRSFSQRSDQKLSVLSAHSVRSGSSIPSLCCLRLRRWRLLCTLSSYRQQPKAMKQGSVNSIGWDKRQDEGRLIQEHVDNDFDSNHTWSFDLWALDCAKLPNFEFCWLPERCGMNGAHGVLVVVGEAVEEFVQLHHRVAPILRYDHLQCFTCGWNQAFSLFSVQGTFNFRHSAAVQVMYESTRHRVALFDQLIV